MTSGSGTLPLDDLLVVSCEQAVAAPLATRHLADLGARSPAGPLRALRPPIDLPGRAPRMDPIPAVGQHTDEILRWLAQT